MSVLSSRSVCCAFSWCRHICDRCSCSPLTVWTMRSMQCLMGNVTFEENMWTLSASLWPCIFRHFCNQVHNNGHLGAYIQIEKCGIRLCRTDIFAPPKKKNLHNLDFWSSSSSSAYNLQWQAGLQSSDSVMAPITQTHNVLHTLGGTRRGFSSYFGVLGPSTPK